MPDAKTMIPSRSVEEWAKACNHASPSWTPCVDCANAYAAEQVASATHLWKTATRCLTPEAADTFVRELEQQVAQARAEEREACAKIIPTNWTDPLLSGANAILQGYGPWGCPEIERLLSALAAAIRART